MGSRVNARLEHIFLAFENNARNPRPILAQRPGGGLVAKPQKPETNTNFQLRRGDVHDAPMSSCPFATAYLPSFVFSFGAKLANSAFPFSLWPKILCKLRDKSSGLGLGLHRMSMS